MLGKPFRRKAGGNYYIRGTVAGCPVYESTGCSNRAQAEAYRARRENEILQRHALGKKATLTFAEAALTYIEAGGESRFLARIIQHFGPRSMLDDIDNASMNEAAAALYPGASPATINRQLITPVSAVINMAAAEGLTHHRKLRRRPGHRQRTRWLTPEEFEALLAQAAPHLAPLLAFLVGSGARTGEALALERQHFHPDAGQAWIAEAKNGHPRMVEFPARAGDLILASDPPDIGRLFRTPKGCGYVLRKNGGGQIQTGFYNARDAAGLGEDVTPHVLRHTWATWYYAATRDFGGLLDLGGWRKSDMAQRYRKIPPADLPARLLAHGWDFTGDGGQPDYRSGRIRAVK